MGAKANPWQSTAMQRLLALFKTRHTESADPTPALLDGSATDDPPSPSTAVVGMSTGMAPVDMPMHMVCYGPKGPPHTLLGAPPAPGSEAAYHAAAFFLLQGAHDIAKDSSITEAEAMKAAASTPALPAGPTSKLTW